MIDDELGHIIKQMAQQAFIEQRPWVYAHVSNYDPATHSVRVIVPSMRDDQTQAPLHSGWLPVGTPWNGAQAGIQIVPMGGASADNPTAGELALVAINERGTGVAAVVCMFYTGQQRPPHTSLPQDQGLKPGEILVQFHTGSRVRFHASSDIEVTAAQDGAINCSTSGKGDIHLSTTGDGTTVVDSKQPVKVNADIQCTGKIFTMFGSQDQVDLHAHIHPQGPDSRGDAEQNTGPPVAGT